MHNTKSGTPRWVVMDIDMGLGSDLDTALAPVRFWNTESKDFEGLVKNYLTFMNGVGPNTDSDGLRQKIAEFSRACGGFTLVNEGWPNKEQFEDMLGWAEQAATTGSRPLQLIFVCKLGKRAPGGAKKPSFGGPMSGGSRRKGALRRITEPTVCRVTKPNVLMWERPFYFTRCILLTPQETQSGKYAVYVVSDPGVEQEDSGATEAQNLQEMVGKAPLKQQAKNAFMDALKRGDSDGVRAVLGALKCEECEAAEHFGHACWTYMDFNDKFSRSPLILAVTMMDKGDSGEGLTMEIKERLKILENLLTERPATETEVLRPGTRKKLLPHPTRMKLFKAQNNNKSTALHVAAHFGHCEIIKALLDAGAGVAFKICSKSGYLPTHVAASLGKREALKLLLKHAPPEVFDCDGPEGCHYYEGRELQEVLALQLAD